MGPSMAAGESPGDPSHDSENVVPSPAPVDGWRWTTMQAITAATATIASAMYGNSL